MAEVIRMIMAENKNVVQINKNEWEETEKTAHQTMESLTRNCEAERHGKKSEQSNALYCQ
jgi:hypothetical protein